MSNYDNLVCRLCGKGTEEEQLVLCDGCDQGFHTFCINLPVVPVGYWFCPACRTEPSASVPTRKLIPRTPVYFYERVSSKGQDKPEYGRVGMDTQNTVMLDFAYKNGLVVRGTFQDVFSARDPSKLKGLGDLCKVIKNTCVLVYSVSRFSRNLLQGRDIVEQIHKAGGWVYSITDHASSDEDRFFLLMQDAQAESDRLSQKIKDSHARIRLLGGHIGKAPYGKMAVRDEAGIRRLEDNPEEQKIITYAKEVQSGTKDIKRTVKFLNEKGVLRRGKNWKVGSLRGLLLE